MHTVEHRVPTVSCCHAYAIGMLLLYCLDTISPRLRSPSECSPALLWSSLPWDLLSLKRTWSISVEVDWELHHHHTVLVSTCFRKNSIVTNQAVRVMRSLCDLVALFELLRESALIYIGRKHQPYRDSCSTQHAMPTWKGCLPTMMEQFTPCRVPTNSYLNSSTKYRP